MLQTVQTSWSNHQLCIFVNTWCGFESVSAKTVFSRNKIIVWPCQAKNISCVLEVYYGQRLTLVLFYADDIAFNSSLPLQPLWGGASSKVSILKFNFSKTENPLHVNGDAVLFSVAAPLDECYITIFKKIQQNDHYMTVYFLFGCCKLLKLSPWIGTILNSQ